jgi:hypothetical protein
LSALSAKAKAVRSNFAENRTYMGRSKMHQKNGVEGCAGAGEKTRDLSRLIYFLTTRPLSHILTYISLHYIKVI